MKNTIIFFFALAITVGIYSCNCKNQCNEGDEHYNLELQGFSDSEVTPLILKAYIKGSGFTNIIDSIILSNPGTASWTSSPVYLLVALNDTSDYLVILPKVDSFYYLTNMSFPLVNCQACLKTHQIGVLQSYEVNGTSMNVTASSVILAK